MAKKGLESALKNGVESRLKKAAIVATSGENVRTKETDNAQEKKAQETEKEQETERVEEPQINQENKEISESKGTGTKRKKQTKEERQKRAEEVRQKMATARRTNRQLKKARVELRVTEDVKLNMEDLALLNGLSITEYIVQLVEEDTRKNALALRALRRD